MTRLESCLVALVLSLLLTSVGLTLQFGLGAGVTFFGAVMSFLTLVLVSIIAEQQP